MKPFITSLLIVLAIVYVFMRSGDMYPRALGSQDLLTGSVVSVVDGDTFKLQVGARIFEVQMVGIDAPETGQRFGKHAKNHLSEMVKSRSVVVEVHRTDSNGDLLGELFLDGISINELMLTDGFVWAKRGFFEDSSWAGLEHLARDKNFGLWRDDIVMPPWEFREKAGELTKL